jgi:DNA-binding CsgD family transcriptional regulator
MARVSWRAVRAVLEASRLANMSTAPLVEGLAFDMGRLSATPWVAWDDYCTLIERFETMCGGPAALESFLTDHLMYKELHIIAGAFVSPTLLYQFIFRIADPLAFPSIDFLYDELPGGRLSVEYRFHPDARSCLALGRASTGAMRAVPCYLGLPPAVVEADVGERSGKYLVTPPASRTIAARLRRRARGKLDGLFALMQDLLSESRPDLIGRAAAVDPAPHANGNGDHLQRVARAYGLTPRQTEVLDAVVAGLSNKEIAVRHSCAENTVELHVTNLFRKLSVQSRTQLVAKFWSLP